MYTQLPIYAYGRLWQVRIPTSSHPVRIRMPSHVVRRRNWGALSNNNFEFISWYVRPCLTQRITTSSSSKTDHRPHIERDGEGQRFISQRHSPGAENVRRDSIGSFLRGRYDLEVPEGQEEMGNAYPWHGSFNNMGKYCCCCCWRHCQGNEVRMWCHYLLHSSLD